MALQVASRLQLERGVRRGLALTTVVLAFAGGCFYSGDLNDRPSAEIERLTAGMPLRGDIVRFQAVVVDPGDQVEVSWRVDACRGSDPEVCDRGIAFSEPSVLTLQVRIPDNVVGPDPGPEPERQPRPTERLRVHLDVIDSHGAIARPSQEDIVDVGNRVPMLDVQRRGREHNSAFPEDAPIFVAARATDPEGDPVVVECQPFPARGATPGAWSWTQMPDPASGGHEWRLVPDVPGAWLVRCTASDPLAQVQLDTPITVVADRPPCLGATDPAPAPGATLVLDEPRRFSVLVVEDDLDVYPAPDPDDPFLGAAGFRWSVRPVGAAEFIEVDADVAAIELDPAQHAPGDRLDVRVELDDRRRRDIGCPIAQPTCSLTLDTCLQRQTWRVEVR